MGHHISVRPDWTNSSSPVVIQKKGGALNGAADPRRSRFILGR
jgi:gamma-glutamyltranspeptidase